MCIDFVQYLTDDDRLSVAAKIRGGAEQPSNIDPRVFMHEGFVPLSQNVSDDIRLWHADDWKKQRWSRPPVLQTSDDNMTWNLAATSWLWVK
jgi:hypothetical protein